MFFDYVCEVLICRVAITACLDCNMLPIGKQVLFVLPYTFVKPPQLFGFRLKSNVDVVTHWNLLFRNLGNNP